MIQVSFLLKSANVDRPGQVAFLSFECGCKISANFDCRGGTHHFCDEHTNKYAQDDLWAYAKDFVVRAKYYRNYFEDFKVNPDLARLG